MSDAKLITRALRARYPELHVERVDDAAGMRAALASGTWDVILSDWSIPGFGGAAALRLLKDLGHDLPLILVSGTIGEEAAVAAMREGARDYVLKDQLARLASAVEREVREGALRADLARRREHAEDELRDAHETLRRDHDALEARVDQRTQALGVANEALRTAKEAAEGADRAKSAFLANMSHEIRTPMNAILGYTQLLQRCRTLEPDQRQYLDVISRSCDQLLDLINDVLEMSKIEAGFRKVSRDPLDIQPMLADLERMFRLRADAKQLTFAIERASDLPRYIVSDEGKLRQVLVNLLGNSMKFTMRGGVVARLSVTGADGAAPRLVAEIADTGPGIDADELEGLFQPFAQARVGLEAQGGTGLGLALSRELARLMGGDITARSTVGVGSVFRLELPLELGSPVSPARRTLRAGRVVGLLAAGPGPRILVVDDNDDNRIWLSKLLKHVGFQVREEANGADALAAFDAWAPHAVLMDLHMPTMDGFTAIRALRARPTGRSVAIVAVTASAFDDMREAIFEAGADGWLRKPCREGPLFEEIARLIGVRYRYVTLPVRSSSSATLPAVAVGLPRQRRLAPELAERLALAARIADFEQLGELIATIPPDHAYLAEDLRRLTDRYGYEEIQCRLDLDAGKPQSLGGE